MSFTFFCNFLLTFYLQTSVTEIAQNVFENVSTPLLIVAKPGSYAAEFALDNNLDFTADTVRRALIIGQTDYPAGHELYGPQKDIVKLGAAFEEYEVTMMTNLKADEILAAITMAFHDAKEEDISLFYFSGHGNEEDGALVGIDMDSRLTAYELRTALDAVPGRKVVLVDACYSGALIGKSSVKEVETDQAAAFVQAFIGGGLLRSASLAAPRYFVMVSSKGEEESWEADYGGLFTDALVKSRRYGDKNQDDVVSFEEAYSYTAARVHNIASVSGRRQTVQAYPENCYWFGLYR